MQNFHPIASKYETLKARLLEINDITSAAGLLYWDQATYMPPGGATARGRQIATLRQIAHQKFTDPALGELLEDLKSYEESLGYDSDAASLIRVTRRKYQKAIQVPEEFMARMSKHHSATYAVWAKARAENDFRAVQPYLEKNLELSQEMASFFPGYEHIADPLIDFYDYGMTVAQLRPLFTDLKSKLIHLVEAIASQPPIDNSFLHQHFPEHQQLNFTRKVVTSLGYDFNRGRQDKTLHPFMTKFSLGDVRITTRVYENDFSQALFSSIHETGHALYEQGICPSYEGSPLANGTSAGIHESQSRLWENTIGRSRGFWGYFYPQLQGVFLNQLKHISVDQFYRGINKVERSLIRTDADEVTYNLHVAIRFELELDLLAGKLTIQDLPEAWNQRYESDLGIRPQGDRDGVMQDVHWYSGLIGGQFQGYTLGNAIAAQIYQTAIRRNPAITVDIEQGKFDTLHQWLKENIYQHGSKYTPNELLERVTGQPLTIEPFITYIYQKYHGLYDLNSFNLGKDIGQEINH